MRHTINYQKKALKVLDLETEEELLEFAKRLQGHLKKKGTTIDNIVSGIFILKDIKEKSIKRKAKNKIKNKVIRKYSKEIVAMRLEGVGSLLISKNIKKLYGENISNTSIYKYLKSEGYY